MNNESFEIPRMSLAPETRFKCILKSWGWQISLRLIQGWVRLDLAPSIQIRYMTKTIAIPRWLGLILAHNDFSLPYDCLQQWDLVCNSSLVAKDWPELITFLPHERGGARRGNLDVTFAIWRDFAPPTSKVNFMAVHVLSGRAQETLLTA